MVKTNNYYWDYSTYSDILHVHRKGEINRGSIELGDFCIDLNKKDEVVGIEIEWASEFFSQLDITKEQLTQITDAELIIDKRNPQAHIIFLSLKFPTLTKKIAIPMQVLTA
ncbi:DUF2283 domain-containing protein [Candidatus Woesearchaeota archaeon]|nr:DUF2283 domain-containing protein [Candidatus Woesearchaeota archaeon]